MTDEKKTDQTGKDKDRGADLSAALSPDPMKSGVDSTDAAAPGDAKGEKKPRRTPVDRSKSVTEKLAESTVGNKDEAVRGQTMPAQYEGDGYGDVPVQMRGE